MTARPRLGGGQDDLPAVGRVRGALDQAALLQLRHDLGERRRLTRSASASSRGVSAPCSSRLVNADSWVIVRSPIGRAWRSRRLSRVMLSRSAAASCAPVIFEVTDIHHDR